MEWHCCCWRQWCRLPSSSVEGVALVHWVGLFSKEGVDVSCCWGKFGSIAEFDMSGSGKKVW